MRVLRRLLVGMLAVASASAAGWKASEPGWRYEFPRDHRPHEEFKTEWWYFTGNLTDGNGRRFGYQLTFFRHGMRPPAERTPELSRFIVGDLKFAHFTVTDVGEEKFYFDQKVSRGAFGEAGFDEGERLAWIENWQLKLLPDGSFELEATLNGAAIRLRLIPAKAPVIHGENGLSKKAAVEGHASHYYSLTRLQTAGELRIGKRNFHVSGDSWFDHEWATNQLAPGQIGWDWLSVHFEDGSELMLYQVRLEDGRADPASSGTLIPPGGGAAVHLPASAFRMTPTEFWKSGRTPGRYPIGWRVEVPAHALEFNVSAAIENQELALLPLAYWEGAVEINGTKAGRPTSGRGYLELTGYAGPLKELSR